MAGKFRDAANSAVGAFGVWLLVFSVISLLGWTGTRATKWVLFDINCGGRITRAAHANTVELARTELEVVVKYLEDNHHTSGYTSVVYQTPDEDVGFWYTNLKDSLEELRHVKTDASQLEKSNVLLKLRESLQRHGEKGDNVIVPMGLTVHPNNAGYMAWFGVSLLLGVTGFFIVLGSGAKFS